MLHILHVKCCPPHSQELHCHYSLPPIPVLQSPAWSITPPAAMLNHNNSKQTQAGTLGVPQHCTVTRRFLGPTSAALSQHPPLLSNVSLPSISTRTNTCTPRCTSHLPRLPRHLGYTLPLATLHTSAEPIYSLLSVIPLISDRSAETTQRHCRHHRRTHSQESQPLSLPAMQKPNHSTYLHLSQSCQLW